jgi:Heterokaryon incompatibility protein (HET)
MRLLDVETFQLEEFHGDDVPPYAILSHTWETEEVLFSDLSNPYFKHKQGWKKIAYTCSQAKLDGFQYAWIDTCCIDKTSSSELSEAINSMYRWYAKSAECYVYLSDVNTDDGKLTFLSSSRWFTRGWTLQELLAPELVRFYDRNWNFLGHKFHRVPEMSLTTLISKTTGISVSVLIGERSIHTESVACRMSWASCRKTTRTEDMTYCLLGLFNINMPLLYGEGNKAFIRLQEEILKTANDHSILAWGFSESRPFIMDFGSSFMDGEVLPHYLAPSPQFFRYSASIDSVGTDFYGEFSKDCTQMAVVTPNGLRITLPVIHLTSVKAVALIGCASLEHVFFCFGIYLVESATGYERMNIRRPDHHLGDCCTFLVSMKESCKAKPKTIHVQTKKALEAEFSTSRNFVFHPGTNIFVTNRAQKLGIGQQIILLPSNARVVTSLVGFVSEGNDVQIGIETEYSWNGKADDCYDVRIQFSISNDQVNGSFVVWMRDNDTAISPFIPATHPVTTEHTFFGMVSMEIRPREYRDGSCQEEGLVGNLKIKVRRRDRHIFNHIVTHLEIDATE